MKTFDLPHDTLNSFTKKMMAFHHKLEQRSPVHFHLNLRIKSASIKTIRSYVADAISEGLKQNLLGNDINMEFLILTVRSYSHLLAKSVVKQTAGKRFLNFSVTDNRQLVS